MNNVTELMELFVSQYQLRQFAQDGATEETQPAPLDELDTQLELGCADKTQALGRKTAAREGIEHFVAFCRRFLLEHPPEMHIMLAQGFGVRLAGGYDVSLVPEQFGNLEGQLEHAPAIPVTVGLGSPGMRGVEATPSYAVTGSQHPQLRHPTT
jgi:hypothetical protein